MLRLAFRGAVALCLLVLVAPLAFAQDTTIPLSTFIEPLRPYLFEAVSLIVAAAVAFCARRFSAWMGIEMEALHRQALQSALENGARILISRLDDAAAGKTVDVGHPATKAAIEYVMRSVPDAVNHFGLTPDRLAEFIKPKLIPKP